jgi:hypothetical protein
MVEGFQRVFAATIFFCTEQQPERMAVVDLARFQFFDRMQLWFNTTEQQQPLLAEYFDNLITLSSVGPTRMACTAVGTSFKSFQLSAH